MWFFLLSDSVCCTVPLSSCKSSRTKCAPTEKPFRSRGRLSLIGCWGLWPEPRARRAQKSREPCDVLIRAPPFIFPARTRACPEPTHHLLSSLLYHHHLPPARQHSCASRASRARPAPGEVVPSVLARPRRAFCPRSHVFYKVSRIAVPPIGNQLGIRACHSGIQK